MSKPTHPKASTTKFAPAPGEDFDITAAEPEILKAKAMLETTRTRNFLARVVVIAILAAVVLATGLSLYQNNYQLLTATWAAAAAMLTTVLTYYFKTTHRSSG